MSLSKEDLKSSYNRNLWIFAAANVALFWVIIITQGELSDLKGIFTKLTVKDGLFVLFAPIGTLVLNGIFSADTKTRFIFWRWNDPLPGSKAFTKYLFADHRIDITRLKNRWGELQSEPADQNRLWYQMYTKVEDEVSVKESHRTWLFARDLTSYSVIFVILFSPLTFLSMVNLTTKAAYFLLLLIQYVLLLITSRSYGERFVCNVLTRESHRDNQPD